MLSQPVSFVSRLLNFLGKVTIGPPAIDALANIYLLPADRVRVDPPQPQNTQWLHDHLAAAYMSREITRRMGAYTTVALVAVMFAGFMLMGLIAGIKMGATGLENAIHAKGAAAVTAAKQLTPAQVAACDTARQSNQSPLPEFCKE